MESPTGTALLQKIKKICMTTTAYPLIQCYGVLCPPPPSPPNQTQPNPTQPNPPQSSLVLLLIWYHTVKQCFLAVFYVAFCGFFLVFFLFSFFLGGMPPQLLLREFVAALRVNGQKNPAGVATLREILKKVTATRRVEWIMK